MAHANNITGATVYVDDGTGGYGPAPVPEDTFTADGWPTTDRWTGPGNTFGSGVVIDIDLDA